MLVNLKVKKNLMSDGTLLVVHLSDRSKRQERRERDRPLPPLLARVNGQIEV